MVAGDYIDVELVVADYGDQILDSAVYLQVRATQMPAAAHNAVAFSVLAAFESPDYNILHMSVTRPSVHRTARPWPPSTAVKLLLPVCVVRP
jgi:hypothetical protein